MCRVLRGVQVAEGLQSLPLLARPQGGFRMHLRGRSTEAPGSVACGLQVATSDAISYYINTAAGSDCIDDLRCNERSISSGSREVRGHI